MNKKVKKNLLIFPILMILIVGCEDYRLKLVEEKRNLKTYPFSDPNPIPILTQDKRLYPYHKFVGYTHDSTSHEWKVIRMENEHIEVWCYENSCSKGNLG